MIYEPAEDSFLIQKEVKRLAKGDVLEIGIGSGILIETALKSKKVTSALGVDIKKEAVDHCKERIKAKNARFLVSDLFEKVPKKRFDTIIFNPPYLPHQEGELWELSTDIAGGRKGYELIERMFKDVNDYLTPDGFVLLLFSTITGKSKVEEIISSNLMEFVPLSKKAIAFEQLHVYKVQKSRLRKVLEKKGVTDIRPFAKGHRGYIHTGVWKKERIAVKSQRQDIDAEGTVDNEWKQLKLLNRHGIGPEVMFSGKDHFAYRFVEGRFILDFIDDKNTKKEDVLGVFRQVFEQMYMMDTLGVNKEEMHHPVKHIVVDGNNKAFLLDFERCRPRDTTHNVTQFCQFVISGLMIKHLERHGMKISLLDMMKLSKEYAHEKTKANFDAILALLK